MADRWTWARRISGRFFPWIQLTDVRLRRWRNRGGKDFEQGFAAEQGLGVIRGPFKGLAFSMSAIGGPQALLHKLIGSYESELHEPLERAIGRSPSAVVNIGAGDGYYAVGFALRLPSVRVYGFEIDPTSRQICTEVARKNGVADRIEMRRFCTAAQLRGLDLSAPLVFCDCESCELDVLRPDLVPWLSEAMIIVELHDFIDARITETILARFADTHGAEIVPTSERDPSAYPELEDLDHEARLSAICEGRPDGMQWAVLSPLRGAMA